MAKSPKILINENYEGRWVKCWKEKREWVVQIWNSGEPKGEPDGDWAMPGIIGMTAAIDQAIRQTEKK